MQKLLYIFLLSVFVNKLQSQTKVETVGFILHCLENEVEVEENLSQQLDSIYELNKFNDTNYVTSIQQVVIFGYTDSKGSKKENQLLSEKRANYVYSAIRKGISRSNDIIVGFGETQPIADNKTAVNRSKNRRVEVTITFHQYKREFKPQKIRPSNDTLIMFEDSTLLLINKDDYKLIKNNLIYNRKTSLFSLFENLPDNMSDDLFYRFDEINFTWADSNKCLTNQVTLSVKIPNAVAKEASNDIKAYCKKFKGQQVKLSKHKDGCWYIDIITYCPWRLGCAGFRCKSKPLGKLKKVRYVSKENYRMVAAFYDMGQMFSYKKIKSPVKKVRFKVTCPNTVPLVSIVAINKKNLDTLYYASGTEKKINHRKRCFNCIDKEVVVGKFLGIKIHKRLLRRKYIFKPKDYAHKMPRKISHEKN